MCLIFIDTFRIGVPLYISYRVKKKQKAEEEVRWRKQREYDGYQQNVRQHLLGFVTQSTTILQSLPKEIESADRALDKAEVEFADGAFAPFWDAVEHAVTCLARLDRGIQQILENSTNHKTEMVKLDSTPPAFRLDIDTLPGATRTADRMHSIVRRAQKDFQFATIYEQRKTNQLLVEGFANLGQALNEMSYRLNASIDALSESLSDAIYDLSRSNRENTQELISEVGFLRVDSQSDA